MRTASMLRLPAKKWNSIMHSMAPSRTYPTALLESRCSFSSEPPQNPGSPMGIGRSAAPPPSPPDLSFLHRHRGPSQKLDTSTAIAIATELLDIAEEDPPPPPKREPSPDVPYESPMQSFFDDMYNNGPTSFGTTDEILQYEESVSKQQKVMSCGIPESKLRFTTTSWGRTMMAPFVQNNEHRVICKINLDDLPFAKGSPECDILQQIVGPRLNYDRNELRLTCNQFGSRIENKRHLVSMMDRIISSCQRLGAELPPQDAVASVLEEASTGSSAAATTTVVAGVLEEAPTGSSATTTTTAAAGVLEEAPTGSSATATATSV